MEKGQDHHGKNVLSTDLSGKVAVVTGAGGVLCSDLAKTLARAGAKVALLNRSTDAIERFAKEINDEGGTAKAYKCNVLEKDTCLAVAEEVLRDLGPCDILVNGAGGNNPKAQTDKEYYEPGDIDADTQSFFDLSEDGVDAVFRLNFIATLLPTQAFAKQMVGRSGWQYISQKKGSVSTRLHPAFSQPSRMRSFFSMRMVRPPRVQERFLPRRRWDGSGKPKNWREHCCSS